GVVITPSPFVIGGGMTEATNGWDLNPGDVITCDYEVTIDDDVRTGDPSILNTARASADTADGEVSSEQPLISEEDDAEVGVPEPSFVKTRTSIAVAQPGDLVTYEIVVTLPEGVTNGLTITDMLPAEFAFDSASITAGWGGTLPEFDQQPTLG